MRRKPDQEGALPIYEYLCKKCGRRFERIQKFSDKPLKTCEECGGALERLLSSPAIQFKGSGFYITDYARKSSGETASKSEAPSDGGSKTAPAESSGSKSPTTTKTTGTKKAE
jgi:putative FmdB family regulatory protein